MSAAVRAPWASLALLAALLVGCCALARAQASPVPGGTVPSTLELSLGEPSGFKRTGSTPDGKNVYTATVRAEVTSTDAPVRLSVGGDDASFTQPLKSWSEPVAHGAARVRLRAIAPSAQALRDGHELFLVTLTAGGP